jgi:hypothetical protein
MLLFTRKTIGIIKIKNCRKILLRISGRIPLNLAETRQNAALYSHETTPPVPPECGA